MFLGIEIGGTKLQLGVGAGDGSPLVALERFTVDAEAGGEGLRQQIETTAKELQKRFNVQGVGIGFGGPFNQREGRTIKSHHVAGWDDFPLVAWCQQLLHCPVSVENDADTAGLAEALFGAGRGCDPVLYLTIGTGIGGGLIQRGEIYRGTGRGAVEIGHLRPGLQADQPEAIVESFAAGWGIAAAAQTALTEPIAHSFSSLTSHIGPAADAEDMRLALIEAEDQREQHAADLLDRCQGQPELLTTKLVSEAAQEGNLLAQQILHRAWRALGWAIAQAITLLAPEVVILGGGVSLIGETHFFQPLRDQISLYVFPPLLDTYRLLPASLGEEVVIHGALALARSKGK